MITPDQVLQMRESFLSGKTARELAYEYKLTYGQIYRIIKPPDGMYQTRRSECPYPTNYTERYYGIRKKPSNRTPSFPTPPVGTEITQSHTLNTEIKTQRPLKRLIHIAKACV